MRVTFALAAGEFQFIDWVIWSGLAMHTGCADMKPFFVSIG